MVLDIPRNSKTWCGSILRLLILYKKREYLLGAGRMQTFICVQPAPSIHVFRKKSATVNWILRQILEFHGYLKCLPK